MDSKVKIVTGQGVPVVGNDIDTDRIIPARFLKCVTFDGLGEHVFADDRAKEQGRHPFDQPQYQGATVLVVNSNFGCGSSREHAPQAIARWGIQTIVGESFAGIFLDNCIAIGVPCLIVDAATSSALQSFIATNPQAPVSVDLEALQVTWSDQSAAIAIAEGARQAFLSGTWDACGQLVAHADSVRSTAAQLPYLSWA